MNGRATPVMGTGMHSSGFSISSPVVEDNEQTV